MRLRRSKFKAWLEAKRPKEIVGERGSCTGCPIAQFYLETSGGDEIAILDSDCGFRIDRGDGGRLSPEWAENFMRAIDDQQPKSISARLALELLGTYQ